MKLTPAQLTQLSDAIEECVDSAEIQDPELRKVAHEDMLALAVRGIENDMFTFEFILDIVETTIKRTKIGRMRGFDMESDMKEMAVKRGLMKEE